MATQLFQPPTGTVHWLKDCIERAKSHEFSEIVMVTPGLASVMLDSNPNNRNLSERKIQQYARDMIAGRWTFNGETLIVANTGELNDGQHRLQAVIESNLSQRFLIVFGVPRATRITVDQGMARSAGHYLAMEGVESSKLCAAIAGLVMAFEASGGKSMRDSRTHAEVIERVRADSQIGKSAHFANTVQKFAKGLLTPSQIGICHYLFNDISPADANEFLTQVCVGENIKRGHPAFATRQALNGMKGEQRLDRLEVVFRGWNAFRQRRKLQLAKILGTLPALV